MPVWVGVPLTVTTLFEKEAVTPGGKKGFGSPQTESSMPLIPVVAKVMGTIGVLRHPDTGGEAGPMVTPVAGVMVML
jgi:hypothetical protein